MTYIVRYQDGQIETYRASLLKADKWAMQLLAHGYEHVAIERV